MSAAAFALGKVVPATTAPVEQRAPAFRRLPRHLMVRFDAAGRIQWMNAAALEVLGIAGSVVGVLTGGHPAALTSLPIGNQWLWLGNLQDGVEPSLSSRLSRINLALSQVFRCLGANQVELLRAHGIFEQCYRRAERRRLLRSTSADFIAALEAERGRIARDLHDGAGQSLAGILLNLELVERHLSSANTEALARLARSRELASLTLHQIRRIAHDLNPPEWSEMDFPAAVDWLVETMGVRTKLAVQVDPIETPSDLPSAIKTMLYRTLQEGLTNVLRHSGAQRVRIQAPVTAGSVRLILEDDGRGFDPAAPKPAQNGIGLSSIRQRIESLGGRLEVSSGPGRGTRLAVSVPVGGGES